MIGPKLTLDHADIAAALEMLNRAPEVTSWSLSYTHPYGLTLYAHGRVPEECEGANAKGRSLYEAAAEAIHALSVREEAF